MRTLAILGLTALLAPCAPAARPQSPAQFTQSPAQTQSQTGASSSKPVVLDRVVAIVNGAVLLQSDVDQERRLAVLSPLLPRNKDTDAKAAQRLIRRTLVLEQMKQQDQPTTVSKARAEQGLKKLRASLHACMPLSCSSQKGWDKFLKQHGITQQEALERWSQRMAVQNFINIRFRAGIRISNKQISTYYNHTLVPALKANHLPVPALDQVSSRIRQLLLAQHVNAMINEWLKTLRAEGTVQILVPAYGKSTPPPADTTE